MRIFELQPHAWDLVLRSVRNDSVATLAEGDQLVGEEGLSRDVLGPFPFREAAEGDECADHLLLGNLG